LKKHPFSPKKNLVDDVIEIREKNRIQPESLEKIRSKKTAACERRII